VIDPARAGKRLRQLWPVAALLDAGLIILGLKVGGDYGKHLVRYALVLMVLLVISIVAWTLRARRHESRT
jgi:hypothetical protein